MKNILLFFCFFFFAYVEDSRPKLTAILNWLIISKDLLFNLFFNFILTKNSEIHVFLYILGFQLLNQLLSYAKTIFFLSTQPKKLSKLVNKYILSSYFTKSTQLSWKKMGFHYQLQFCAENRIYQKTIQNEKKNQPRVFTVE